MRSAGKTKQGVKCRFISSDVLTQLKTVTFLVTKIHSAKKAELEKNVPGTAKSQNLKV